MSSKYIFECYNCGSAFCGNCSNANEPESYCSKECEREAESEDDE